MISPLEARYYRRRMPLLWWTRRRSYATFMLRELSSVFVALFVVELLLLLRAVTFANLTPRAMVVRLRGRTVPSRAVLAGVYLGWLVVTAFLAWLVVG